MKEFQKGTQFYKERLGLEFERDGQSHLSFVFRNIDIDQCSKPFSITFEIDQNDCYIGMQKLRGKSLTDEPCCE